MTKVDLEKDLTKLKTKLDKVNIILNYVVNEDENGDVLNGEFFIELIDHDVLGYGKNQMIKVEEKDEFVDMYLKELIDIADLSGFSVEAEKIRKLIS